MAQKDYLIQLLENMQAQLSSIDGKQDDQGKKLSDIHIQTTKTNGKVIQLRKDVDSLQKKSVVVPKKSFALPEIPAPVLYLLALSFLIVLIIVAWGLKIDLSGIL